jgi:hypothetical protein
MNRFPNIFTGGTALNYLATKQEQKNADKREHTIKQGGFCKGPGAQKRTATVHIRLVNIEINVSFLNGKLSEYVRRKMLGSCIQKSPLLVSILSHYKFAYSNHIS